jgi:hypothetical protein
LSKLNCFGIASCRGKLTLTAEDAVRAKGAVRELAPSPENTQTKTVHLIRGKTTKARKL